LRYLFQNQIVFFFIVGGKNLTGNAQEGTAAGIKRPMQAEPNSGLKNSRVQNNMPQGAVRV
jgi:hypothetical protein